MALPVILTKKLGPLPGWAWGGLGIGVALALASWQKSKSEAADADTGIEQNYELPENLSPTYVFQNYDQDRTYIDVGTPVTVPPGAGRPPTRPTLPATKPGGSNPPPGRTVPASPVGVVNPPPRPAPAPVKLPTPPPAPKGQWVPVVPWKTGRKPGTPDSIWGIAEKVFGSSKVTRALTNMIWSAPQNATLRAKRKAPDKIQPGDKVWVPQ